MRGSVSVSLRVPESDHHTENLQFLKVLKKQKKIDCTVSPKGGARMATQTVQLLCVAILDDPLGDTVHSNCKT